MKFIEHKNDKTHTGYYQVTVSGADWTNILAAARRAELSTINIKGFRKGNVPEKIAEQYLSEAKVLARAHKKFIKQAYAFMNAQDKKIKPYLSVKGFQSEIIKTTSTLCTVNFNFDLIPLVNCENWSNIKVNRKKISATKQEVALAIAKLREKNAFLELKNKAVEDGDTVIIDFDGFMNGKPFPNGKATNFQLKIGSKSMIKGFEEAIIGMKPEEYKSINLTFPKNYHVVDLRDKKVKFDVFLHEVKISVVPELNAEFYQSLNYEGVSNKTELEAYVKAEIIAEKTKKATEEEAEVILDQLFKLCTVKIPPSLKEAELFMQRRGIMDQIKKDKINFQDYLKYIKKTEKDFFDELDREAIDRLKLSFILKEIGDQEKVVIGNSEYKKFVEKTAQQQNVSVKSIEDAMMPKREEVMFRLRNDKIWELICERVVVKDVSEATTKTKSPVKKLPTTSKNLKKDASKPNKKPTRAKMSKKGVNDNNASK